MTRRAIMACFISFLCWLMAVPIMQCSTAYTRGPVFRWFYVPVPCNYRFTAEGQPDQGLRITVGNGVGGIQQDSPGKYRARNCHLCFQACALDPAGPPYSTRATNGSQLCTCVCTPALVSRDEGVFAPACGMVNYHRPCCGGHCAHKFCAELPWSARAPCTYIRGRFPLFAFLKQKLDSFRSFCAGITRANQAITFPAASGVPLGAGWLPLQILYYAVSLT